MGILRLRIWNAGVDKLVKLFSFTVAGPRIHALHYRKQWVGSMENAQRGSSPFEEPSYCPFPYVSSKDWRCCCSMHELIVMGLIGSLSCIGQVASLNCQRQDKHRDWIGPHRQSNVCKSLPHTDLWYCLVKHGISRKKINRSLSKYLFHLWKKKNFRTNTRKDKLDCLNKESLDLRQLENLDLLEWGKAKSPWVEIVLAYWRVLLLACHFLEGHMAFY